MAAGLGERLRRAQSCVLAAAQADQPRTNKSAAALRRLPPGPASARSPATAWLLLPVRNEQRDCFHLDQQLRPAENRLDSRGRRQRIQSLPFKEHRAFLVEDGVVTLDIAQITGCPHHVMP